MPTYDPLLEPSRLAAVADLDLAHGRRAEAFEHLNAVAQAMLGVPVSVLSLITEGRQINVSQVGLGDAQSGPTELPLSHSLCQHVARSGAPLVIDDTATSELVRDSLAVRDFGVAAYAGAPLRLDTGEVVGALCASDNVPRAWTAEQVQVLEHLTAVASELLSQRRRLNAGGLPDGDAAGDEPRDTDAARRQRMIRNRLWTAQSRDEFRLDYQPIYALQSSAVSGFEALLRWTNPELGEVAPNEFIEQAEQNGAIVPIGQWVLSQALADLACWRAAGDRDLTMSVNVAPEQLLLPNFCDQVSAALVTNGIPPHALILEVTERTLGEDQPVLRANLTELRHRGVRISVDDFGTGYSSMSRLATLPLDELKIDRSFIAAMQEDPRQHALVATIIAMANTLGLTPVAEGIETLDQHAALTAIGCTLGQGYLIARPAPAHHIRGMLGATEPLAA